MSESLKVLSAQQAIEGHSPPPFRLTRTGRLAGYRLAVKDLFHLLGAKNSAGNPDWLAIHPPATETAGSLQRLLDEGAEFIGFSLTDELAYSLEGNNAHRGVVENPACPGCLTGGSSTGSAALVAAGLADIALGTDTGGSVRIPAGYCGLFGFRPSMDTVERDGVIPLAPAFDTVGWFTRSAELLETVGDLLLEPNADKKAPAFRQALVLDDFFSLADDDSRKAADAALHHLRAFYDSIERLFLPAELLNDLPDIFRILQGRNAFMTHRAWLATEPELSPAVRQRFKAAQQISDEEVDLAKSKQQTLIEWLTETVAPDDTLFLPTAPTTAPLIGQYSDDVRRRTLRFTALAGLAGWPQCHLPFVQPGSKPAGVSLIKPKHLDRSLLAEVSVVGAWL